MTAFSFTFEQSPGGTMLMRMKHGIPRNATAAEGELHNRVWSRLVGYAARNKIAVVVEPMNLQPTNNQKEHT